MTISLNPLRSIRKSDWRTCAKTPSAVGSGATVKRARLPHRGGHRFESLQLRQSTLQRDTLFDNRQSRDGALSCAVSRVYCESVRI
jgi:hypothetical protein